jgi:hypothetical protein
MAWVTRPTALWEGKLIMHISCALDEQEKFK